MLLTGREGIDVEICDSVVQALDTAPIGLD